MVVFCTRHSWVGVADFSCLVSFALLTSVPSLLPTAFESKTMFSIGQ